MEAPSSASKISMPQYLLLRAIFSTKGTTALKSVCKKPGAGEKIVSKEIWSESENYLKGLTSWKTYLASITGSPHQEGTFALVRYYQQLTNETRNDPSEEDLMSKVTFSPRPVRKTTNRYASRPEPETPTRSTKLKEQESSPSDLIERVENLDMTPSDNASSPSELGDMSPISADMAINYKAIEDEQIVNTALVLFLNAVTLHYTNISSEWTLYRRPFTVQKVNRQKVYEARVDGLLRSKGSQARAQALIEVKPYVRRNNTRMQEAAQMAAWIAEDPPRSYNQHPAEKHRRLLISQNRHQIFVNVASFEGEYATYIRGESKTTNSFLAITEYGPFDVTDRDHMKNLGIAMLAFSLQGGLL
ncbi:hypothetical protein DV735_g44, partial [Chaetothyriales sp. CBS 134920]